MPAVMEMPTSPEDVRRQLLAALEDTFAYNMDSCGVEPVELGATSYAVLGGTIQFPSKCDVGGLDHSHTVSVVNFSAETMTTSWQITETCSDPKKIPRRHSVPVYMNPDIPLESNQTTYDPYFTAIVLEAEYTAEATRLAVANMVN